MADTTSSLSQLAQNRRLIFFVFFFGAFIYLLFQLINIFSPFLTAIIGAGVLSIVFHPVHVRIDKQFPGRSHIAAGLSTALILLIVVVPVILFLWILIREASVIYPTAQTWVLSLRSSARPEGTILQLPAPLNVIFEKADRFLAFWDIDAQDIFLKNVDELGNLLSRFGALAVKNFLFLAFNLIIMVFTLFFFLKDGAKSIRWIVDLVPMERGDKDLIVVRLNQTLSAVVRGLFLTAAVQGIVAGIGFTIFDIRFKVLLSFATAFFALVPFIGATAVWLPVSLYLIVTGSTVKGVLLFVYGVLGISMIDNFLRPILIGERAKLPFFLLFFGILGGVKVYGPLGILTGPLLIALVLAFTKIYREQFQLSQQSRRATDAPPLPPSSSRPAA